MNDTKTTRDIIREVKYKYYTVAEYCKAMGFSRTWFYECLKKGKAERVTKGL